MNVPLVQHKTIDSVLARGERLDSLVEKSSDLSAASQVIFFFLCYERPGIFHYACMFPVVNWQNTYGMCTQTSFLCACPHQLFLVYLLSDNINVKC